MNAHCIIAQSAARWPDHVALQDAAERWTYSQLDRQLDHLAAGWRSRGICEHDRVAITLPAATSGVLAFWSLLRLRAVVCPISPRCPPEAVVQSAADIDAPHVVNEDQVCRWYHDAKSTIRYTSRDAAPPSQHDPDRLAGVDGQIHVADQDRVATILFSSGSTGRPKAIVHTLRAHLASADGANRNLPLGPSDVWLLSLPLFHVSGIGILFRCALAGACVAVPATAIPLDQHLARFDPTHLSLVPTQLQRLLEANVCPEKLRGVLLGGAPVPAAMLARAVRAGWPVMTTYGLTEMASQVTTTCPGAGWEELRTAGRVLPGRELKISDSGEILVRGATRFSGYWQNGMLVAPWSADGWFATGDVGVLDASRRLIVTGRRDNMFISGGENIHPESIERALLEIDGVHQAIVVPIDHADFGARPVAFVEAPSWCPDRWRAEVERCLPRFMVPDFFLPWPIQTGLKPDRAWLRSQAQAQCSKIEESESR